MSAEVISESQIEEYYVDLTKYVDGYISDDPITSEVLYSQGRMIGSIYYYIEDLINQKFIDTATWGLSILETEMNIPIVTTDTFEVRRSRIKSKLRGRGTVTIAMIKNVVESFSNGTVKVIEDNENYQFTIRFIDAMGVPPNIQDVYNAIEEIKPAHLLVNYEFRYTTWDDIKAYSWDEVSKYTWNGVLNGELEGKITTMYSLLSDGITYQPIEFRIEN